jgi:hypothetical protein
MISLPLTYDPLPLAFGEKKRRRLIPYSEEIISTLSISDITLPLTASSADYLYDSLVYAKNKYPTDTEITSLYERVTNDLLIGQVRKGWAIIKVPYPLISVHRSSIKTKPLPSIPTWGPHITVVQGERQAYGQPIEIPSQWGYKAGCQFMLSIDWTLRQTKRHYYFNVTSPELETLREEIGLPRLPDVGFHLTLGRKQ